MEIQKAMERTGLPVYNSAYRRGEDEEMPGEYLIWSEVITPGDFFDDEWHSLQHLVTVHVCSRGNPMGAVARLCVEMAREGLSFAPMQDRYDEDADLYIKVVQFRGEEGI